MDSRLEHRRRVQRLFRVARAALGLRQSDVADQLTARLGREISVFRISRIEQSIQRPREDEIAALGSILNLPQEFREVLLEPKEHPPADRPASAAAAAS